MSEGYLTPIVEELDTEPAGILVGSEFQLRAKVREVMVYPNAPRCGAFRCGQGGGWPWP